MAAFHLLGNRDSASDKSQKSWTTAIHAVDQRLRLWQSKTQAWQELLQQVFGRSAPIEFSGISVEFLDGHTMAGLHGAYTHADAKKEERIYLNADWLNSASATEVEAVLLEELGHALDWRINGSNDTAGDEGAIFSSLIRGVAIPFVETSQNDHHTLIINGQRIAVEAAAPTLSSATYDASSSALAVTGTNLTANSGANNDIDVSKLTLTGEGSNTYTLTSGDVELTSATAFSVTLNAADQLQLAGLLNKNGTSSGGGTTYNIAAALNWNPGASSSPADSTGNAITVSNVAAPSLSSATYNDSVGVLTLSGSNLPAYPSSSNDIDVSKLTITGGSGSTYTLTSDDVELTSATAASITLNSTDQSNLDSLLNKNGTSSTQGTTYNIAAADDWAPGADSSTDIADLAGNAITVSNLEAPSPSPSPTDISISSSSFDENISAGTAVATLSTTDPDSGDTFTYSLVPGTGDTDNSAFTISGNQIKINTSPDYETKNSYSIRARTTDAGGLIYEESLNLSVNDIDESTETAITNSTIITNSQSIFNTSVNGESFNYYIHPGGDITGVGFNNLGNPINQQTVDSSAYESYIVSLFDQIDAVIDLDFTRQSNNNGSTIDIYAVADDGTNKIGTTYFWNSWFDIDFEITGNNQSNQNTLVHELGHALGLDHPFEDGFDARYTVDDTVMSYNIGSSGWTTYFREADLTVLKNIWGVENDVVNTGGGGGGGGSSTTPLTTPVPTPATTPTPSTEVPTQGSTSPAIPVTTTQQPSVNSPVLGIQPQAAVSSIKLDTPLVVGTLQLTQAVVGTVGSDVITGSDAAEVLAGGQGKDLIIGGAGGDAFLFERPGEFGKKNRDTITDFNPDEGDKVIISRDAFDEVKKIKLKVVTGKKNAKNADTEKSTFIYDDKKGLLYFNENLNEDGWGDGGVFARLKGAPELGVSDFTLL